MDNTGIVNLSHYGWTWAVKCEKWKHGIGTYTGCVACLGLAGLKRKGM
ncbi:MAG: hypothetical protein ACJA0G_000257 [Kangiellaceae bacterium]|jgi:hypothetical protein